MFYTYIIVCGANWFVKCSHRNHIIIIKHALMPQEYVADGMKGEIYIKRNLNEDVFVYIYIFFLQLTLVGLN